MFGKVKNTLEKDATPTGLSAIKSGYHVVRNGESHLVIYLGNLQLVEVQNRPEGSKLRALVSPQQWLELDNFSGDVHATLDSIAEHANSLNTGERWLVFDNYCFPSRHIRGWSVNGNTLTVALYNTQSIKITCHNQAVMKEFCVTRLVEAINYQSPAGRVL